jgi:GTP-binding protein
MRRIPKVAIVGRPNVGKSSIFNRIIRRRLAIVHDEPGVTRDRLYGDVEWENRKFTLVDTGGLDLTSDERMTELVRKQIQAAIEESAVLIFVVDAVDGVTPHDRMIADMLRQIDKPVVLVANKADNTRRGYESVEFYELGLSEPLPISAAHNLGIEEMLDRVISLLPDQRMEGEEEDQGIRIAVVGRPNAGKSSIINAILGEERVIVDSQPGTTRDSISVTFHRGEERFTFTDTAGMRRRPRIEADLERYSVRRALKSIQRCDIAWLIIDCTQGIVHQDKAIARYIHKQGKGCIMVVSKWDLAEREGADADEYVGYLRRAFPHMGYAPILLTSALTGFNMRGLLDLTVKVYGDYSARFSTHDLNVLLRKLVSERPHPTVSNRRPSMKYITQVKIKPPTFLIFATYPDLIRLNYEQYILNGIRKAFGGMEGVPLRVEYRDSRALKGRSKGG